MASRARGAERALVLLTDVLMPGVGGAELAERALAQDPGLPVLFMSGYVAPESLPEATRRRAAGFISKPFDAATLLAAVHKASRSRGAGPPRRAPA